MEIIIKNNYEVKRSIRIREKKELFLLELIDEYLDKIIFRFKNKLDTINKNVICIKKINLNQDNEKEYCIDLNIYDKHTERQIDYFGTHFNYTTDTRLEILKHLCLVMEFIDTKFLRLKRNI